ncbi:MAG TPA: FMN-binding protein [Ornithinibacter sp.]|nr:FMN-binding protein [Ornithinibacter sp.]
MRRITTWVLSTISALVLLFSYHTSTEGSGAATVLAQGDAGTASGSTDSGSTDSGSTDSGSTQSSGGETFTGEAISTRYGDVQVEITVQDGTITSSKVVQVPWNDHKDQEINSRAVPILNEEAVAGQGADIDMVSGATYTSEGYIASLQSAIDQANL